MSGRDGWCTPPYITRRLPEVDLDPCSNPRSTVRALRSYSFESGTNGLLLPWYGSVFVNPPFSYVDPWVARRHQADSWCFLVLEDPSTRWWKKLTSFPCFRFSFNHRVDFVAPPGVEASSNDRSCCLICDRPFRIAIGDRLRGLGQWWSTGIV